MKTTTLFSLAIGLLSFGMFALVTGDEVDEEDPYVKVQRYQKICRDEVKLTDEEFAVVTKHQLYLADTKTATTPKRLQCYTRCYMLQAGLYKDRQPNTKHLQATLPLYINSKEKSEAAISKCSKLQGTEVCEVAFNYMLCLVHETGIYM